MRAITALLVTSVLLLGQSGAHAQGDIVRAEDGSIVITDRVIDSVVTVVHATPAAELEGLFRDITKPYQELTEVQQKLIATLERELNLTRAQVEAAVETAKAAAAGEERA